MSRQIKALIERGLVTRTPSVNDARVDELRLSKKGQGVLDAVLDAARAAVQDMIGAVPEAAVSLLLEAMDTLQGVLNWPHGSTPQLRDLARGQPDMASWDGSLSALANSFAKNLTLTSTSRLRLRALWRTSLKVATNKYLRAERQCKSKIVAGSLRATGSDWAVFSWSLKVQRPRACAS